MIASFARGLGKLTFLLASAAFIVAITLMLFGSWLLTWPLLRRSPRDRKLKATMDFAAAGMVLAQVIQAAVTSDTPAPPEPDA